MQQLAGKNSADYDHYEEDTNRKRVSESPADHNLVVVDFDAAVVEKPPLVGQGLSRCAAKRLDIILCCGGRFFGREALAAEQLVDGAVQFLRQGRQQADIRVALSCLPAGDRLVSHAQPGRQVLLRQFFFLPPGGDPFAGFDGIHAAPPLVCCFHSIRKRRKSHPMNRRTPVQAKILRVFDLFYHQIVLSVYPSF